LFLSPRNIDFMQSRFYYLIFVSLFIFSASVAFAQTGVMTTIAGNGSAGYSGDGGPGPAAQLSSPNGVAVDSAGNIYFADFGNNVIRKVTSTTGLITTVAGSISDTKFGGDGGPATSAFLWNPEDVALDAAGNIYIADSFNNRIRKVTAGTGRIDTIAGTGFPGFNGDGMPAVESELNDPAGVAVDSNGNVYIADQTNHRIRKIDAVTGLLTTIAGTGIGSFSGDNGPATSAQLFYPTHVAVDPAGNVYIADSQNYRVRKISASTGIISTIAGTATQGYGGDGGPAKAALLSNPYRVAVDNNGNVFIADTGSIFTVPPITGHVRYVNAKTGEIFTVAGGGIDKDKCPALTSSLQFPIGVTVNGAGSSLYVSDYADNRVRMVALTDTLAKPAITSITPASGVRNTTYTITLSGSGFLIPSPTGCSQSSTVVTVSGSGVAASNVSTSSDSSLTVMFTTAALAPLGTYDVTVTTLEGTSNAKQFTVIQPPATLVSISPATALRGSTATVTLTGTGFDSVPPPSLVVSGTGISVGNVTINSATSINATFTVNNSAPLTTYNVQLVNAGGSSNALTFSVDPPPVTVVYSTPQILNATEQAPVVLQLTNPVPDPITGQLSVTFLPNATNPADDPSVSLVNAQASTRTVNFSFAPNSTDAQFSLAGISLHAGTVAGTIRLNISATQEGGKNVTVSPATFDITVPNVVPVLTDAKILNRTATGFDVQITGYSTSRDISKASFQFGQATGTNLRTSVLQVNLADAFNAYYQSPTASAAGGTFVYRQPLVVQGNVNAIQSVTVTVSNSVGDSLPMPAQ
jgi:sugar lactone lactonase YvrE